MCTWYKHDSLARLDRRVSRLIAGTGYAGYGMFHALLELLAYDKDHYLDNDVKQLARLLGLTSSKERKTLEAVIRDYDLFALSDDGTQIYSRRLLRSLPTSEGAKANTMQVSEVVVKPSTPRKPASISDETRQRRREHMQAVNAKRWSKTSDKPNDRHTDDEISSSYDVHDNISHHTDDNISHHKSNINDNTSHNTYDKPNDTTNDRLNDDLGGYIGGREKREEKKEERDKNNFSSNELVALWATHAPSLKKVRSLSAERKRKLRVRLSEWGATAEEQRTTLIEILTKLEASDFATGRTPRDGSHKDWTATIDWLLDNGNNWVKVLEGNYDNSPIVAQRSTGVALRGERAHVADDSPRETGYVVRTDW